MQSPPLAFDTRVSRPQSLNLMFDTRVSLAPLEFRSRKPPYLVTKFGVVVEILDALAARFEFRNGQLGYRRAKWEFTRAKRQSSGCELKPTCGSRGVFEGGRIVLADLSRPPGDGAGRGYASGRVDRALRGAVPTSPWTSAEDAPFFLRARGNSGGTTRGSASGSRNRIHRRTSL